MSSRRHFFNKAGASELSVTLLNTINLDSTFGTASQAYLGAHISPDGRYLIFNIYGGLERFSRIEMSVYGDISSTLTSTHYTKYNGTPRSICLSYDGTKAYNYSLGLSMYQKNLTTAWAMQTSSNLATSPVSYNISNAAKYQGSMKISSDGYKFWFAITTGNSSTYGADDSILEVNLSTPYDFGTHSSETLFDFGSDINNVDLGSGLVGFTWQNSGNNAILATNTGHLLFYSLSSSYDLSSATFINSVNLGVSEIWDMVSYNDSFIYVVFSNGDLKQYSISF